MVKVAMMMAMVTTSLVIFLLSTFLSQGKYLFNKVGPRVTRCIQVWPDVTMLWNITNSLQNETKLDLVIVLERIEFFLFFFFFILLLEYILGVCTHNFHLSRVPTHLKHSLFLGLNPPSPSLPFPFKVGVHTLKPISQTLTWNLVFTPTFLEQNLFLFSLYFFFLSNPSLIVPRRHHRLSLLSLSFSLSLSLSLFLSIYTLLPPLVKRIRFPGKKKKKGGGEGRRDMQKRAVINMCGMRKKRKQERSERYPKKMDL